MYKALIGAVLILIVIPPFAAVAEEAIQVDEVVVTATRYEELLNVVPANVTVITDEDIVNSTAQNIADLLRTEAGIQVSDVAGNRRNVSVDLRGFGETAALNTLVLVDGRRVNQADLSGVDWAQIPLDRVRRIEIIRGGRGSTLYGDNASGGVINIITKEGGPFRAGAGAAYGSYGTFQGNAYLLGEAQDLLYSLSGSYLTSDGYRENNETDAEDFGLHLGYYLNESIRFDLSSGYHRDDSGLPGALKESDFTDGNSRTDSVNPHDFAETRDFYVKGGTEFYFWKESFAKLEASYRKRDFRSFASFAGGEFTGDTEIQTVTFFPQVLLKQKVGTVNNSLSAGLDYQRAEEKILNDSLFFGFRTIGEFRLQKENYGYYVHDEAEIKSGLLLSGGYRHDTADFIFHPGTPEETSVDEDLFTAGISYTFSNNSRLYLSYSRSFRYPVLDEMFSFFTSTIDTGLLPQRSDDYEVGLRHYVTDSTWFQANLFRIDTDKEIFFNPALYINENLSGTSRREGLEIAFSARLRAWLDLKGSYTYLDASIRSGRYGGNDVPNVPRHKSTLGVVLYPMEALTVSLSGIFIGERPFIGDFDNSFGEQDGYIVMNGKIRYTWRQITAFLDINNLSDKQYSEYGVLGGFPLEQAYYPSPERNLLFGVTVDF